MEIEAYHRDGLLVVRGVLTGEGVELAREAIESVLASRGMLTQVASGVDDPGRFVEDLRRWEEIPRLEHRALSSAVPRYAAELLARWTAPEQPVRCSSLQPGGGIVPEGAPMDDPLFPVVR